MCRFWAENEERSRHAFWFHGGTDLEDDYADAQNLQQIWSTPFDSYSLFYMHIRSLHVVRAHGGRRGPRKQEPISSIGVLDNGEAYFVYRFLLFWDGFQIHAGKSSSGDGLYMHCLNLPARAKSSPSSVRILTLTPPGVNISTALLRILPDIVEGMTDGFLDYDAEGTRRRIFLDLVGFWEIRLP